MSQAEVARLCGVSRSTVSAVLLGETSTAVVGEATRRRVRAAAERLGYRANAAAAALRRGCTHAVALAVPNFKILQSVVAAQVLRGIGERAHELGYALHMCCYEESGDMRESMLRSVGESRVDGVFFYGAHQVGTDPREVLLRNSGLPFVSLMKHSVHGPGIDFDDRAGGRLAASHLVEAGRRRIGFVGADDRMDYAVERKEGFLAALGEAGLAGDRRLILSADNDYAAAGRDAARFVAGSGIPCDGLVCVSDAAAMAVIQTLGALGRRVPDDVAVVGYDDAPYAELASPPLTSVRQDGVALGRQAVDLLDEQILYPRTPPEHRLLPVSLVVRASSGTVVASDSF